GSLLAGCRQRSRIRRSRPAQFTPRLSVAERLERDAAGEQLDRQGVCRSGRLRLRQLSILSGTGPQRVHRGELSAEVSVARDADRLRSRACVDFLTVDGHKDGTVPETIGSNAVMASRAVPV